MNQKDVDQLTLNVLKENAETCEVSLLEYLLYKILIQLEGR